MSESRAATNQKDAARTRPELLHTNKYEIEIVDMDRVLDSKQQLVELYPNVNSNGKNNNTWKRYEFTFTSRWPYRIDSSSSSSFLLFPVQFAPHVIFLHKLVAPSVNFARLPPPTQPLPLFLLLLHCNHPLSLASSTSFIPAVRLALAAFYSRSLSLPTLSISLRTMCV